MLSYGENPESLSNPALNRYRVVTDGRTDRITIANTRSAVPAGTAVARNKTHRRGGLRPRIGCRPLGVIRGYNGYIIMLLLATKLEFPE